METSSILVLTKAGSSERKECLISTGRGGLNFPACRQIKEGRITDTDWLPARLRHISLEVSQQSAVFPLEILWRAAGGWLAGGLKSVLLPLSVTAGLGAARTQQRCLQSPKMFSSHRSLRESAWVVSTEIIIRPQSDDFSDIPDIRELRNTGRNQLMTAGLLKGLKLGVLSRRFSW